MSWLTHTSDVQIDFAYLPSFSMPALEHERADLISRMPILPAYSSMSASNANDHLDPQDSTLKPVISTAAGEDTHIHAPSAMSDVHDGHHEATDFHEIVATISSGAEAIKDAGHAEVRAAWGWWSGLMMDVFGPRETAAGKARVVALAS